MKKNLTTLMIAAMLFAANLIYAQAPNAFNYQAAIRDGSGAILANTNVNLRFTVRNGSASGTPQYRETQDLMTNQFGLVNHSVGTGVIDDGTFAEITWSNGIKYLQVEVSINGGPYASLGAQKLQSVPYALVSGDNHWTKTGDNINNNNTGDIRIGAIPQVPGSKLSVRAAESDILRLDADSGYTALSIGGTGTVKIDGPGTVGGRFIIQDNGRVGIGNANPTVPLEVSGSGSIATGTTWYLNPSGVASGNTQTQPISIRAQHGIISPAFIAFSDKRLKTDVVQSSASKDLDNILKLKVSEYKMIDNISGGNSIHKGFIAQEVNNTMPNAVSINSGFIPNIYALASTLSLTADGNHAVTLKSAHDLVLGDKVKIMADKEVICTVTKITGTKGFEVSGLPKNAERVFVFGKQVNDLLAVDYDQIFTTGIGAIHELSAQVEALKAELSNSNKANELLKSDIDAIKAQLDVLSQNNTK